MCKFPQLTPIEFEELVVAKECLDGTIGFEDWKVAIGMFKSYKLVTLDGDVALHCNDPVLEQQRRRDLRLSSAGQS